MTRTREEAIKILKEDGCGYCTWQSINPYECENKECEVKEALNMAIQALSQEPCDDTVSIRKDVLKCRVGNIVAYDVEWLKKHWQMEMDIVCGVKPCTDAVSRQAVLDGIDAKAWEFCDYLISKGRNDEQKPVSHFADNLREYISDELPSVNPQPCDDAISREAVVDVIYDSKPSFTNDFAQGFFADKIRELPSVTQKSGKWINTNTQDEMMGKVFKCEQCGEDFIKDYNYNYCPNCGCRMVESQESEGKK